MVISFKVSKKGTRFCPKPNPQSPSVPDDNDKVDAPFQLPNIQPPSTRKRSVDDTENDEDIAEIPDSEVSFILNIFQDGYTIKTPSEGNFNHQNAAQNDPKLLCPYTRTSQSLFAAIECGQIPAAFLDQIPLKYSNGSVVCEVRDYRKDSHEQGLNVPAITKLFLKMSLDNVVKDIDQFSDSEWTYGDIMEAEARILNALKPKLCLDPTPNLNRLYKEPTSTNLNLNIPDIRRKRLRQTYEAITVPEKSKLKVGESTMMMQQKEEPEVVYLGTRNVGKSNMVKIGDENNDGGLSLIMSFVDGKKGNQDGELSPIKNLNKKTRSDHGTVKQEQVNHMSGPLTFNVGKEIDKRIIKRFCRMQMLTERLQANRKKTNTDKYQKTTKFPTKHLIHFLQNNDKNILKDETCKMGMSKSVVGGSMNVCKMRVLEFEKQGKRVPKLRTRLMLSEKERNGNVAMHYGDKLDICDYLAKEDIFPTLPNTYIADLFTNEFCSQMRREGYYVESDHVKPKPMKVVQSYSGQEPNSGHGLLVNSEIQQIMESVSRVSVNEVAKPCNGGAHNMHPHGFLPSSSRPHQFGPQLPIYQQQQLPMIASNYVNSSIEQVGNYTVLPQELEILQLQLQLQKEAEYQRKMNEMGKRRLTPAEAAAIIADRMVQQSKTNVIGGQIGNFTDLPMMDYAMKQMNGMDPSGMNQYMNQPPQQVGSLSQLIGMPRQQPIRQQIVMSPQINYGGYSGLNLG